MSSDGLHDRKAMMAGEAGESDQGSLDLVEVTGVIKWFDVSKGYGFIVPDDGGPDVLLHVTCLRRDGFQTASEGTRIVCEAEARSKGLQVFRVLSMDTSTAVNPAELPPRTHVHVVPTSPLVRAEVKWFHMETLRRYGLTELKPGQTVLVRYGDSPKGLMAAEVLPDGPGQPPSSH
jgi:cold shock protein